MTDDRHLLEQYTRNRSESAFSELVARNINLVRKAGSLPRDAVLAGWLHQHACYTASKAVRTERRRQTREQTAMEMRALDDHTEPPWGAIAPHLDEGLSQLSAEDRDAIILRFLKQQDLRTVGAALSISDDAAQKRVSRAVERLREFFAKRGLTVGASGLAVVLSTNAVQAAPDGLAVAISTAAALTGRTVTATATATTTQAIAMTTLQKTVIGVTLAAAVGTGIYGVHEAHQASALRNQVQTIQRQQVPLTEQIQQLTRERDDATNTLALLRDENERLSRNTAELARLRGEVVRLKQQNAIGTGFLPVWPSFGPENANSIG